MLRRVMFVALAPRKKRARDGSTPSRALRRVAYLGWLRCFSTWPRIVSRTGRPLAAALSSASFAASLGDSGMKS